MITIYIGLGSNLGDRAKNLADARKMLTFYPITLIKESSIKETDPVDYTDQPRFLNQIVMVHTNLSPVMLLNTLKEIEQKLGRRAIVPKGPRIIDLDILLYGAKIVQMPQLTIPHPAIKQRDFVMEHLIELTADLRDPETGLRYQELL